MCEHTQAQGWGVGGITSNEFKQPEFCLSTKFSHLSLTENVWEYSQRVLNLFYKYQLQTLLHVRPLLGNTGSFLLKKAFQLDKFCKSAGDDDVAHIQKAAQNYMKTKLLKDELASHTSVGKRVKPPTCPTVVKQKRYASRQKTHFKECSDNVLFFPLLAGWKFWSKLDYLKSLLWILYIFFLELGIPTGSEDYPSK